MEKTFCKIFNSETSKCIPFRRFCIKKVHLDVFVLKTGQTQIFYEFSQFSGLIFSFDFYVIKKSFL